VQTTYCIIGAGPTGLGAANRLKELGEDRFMVLERETFVGGLSASFRDDQGFTWDIGGHVIFSHYPYFDRLLADLLGADYLEHQREAWIRCAGTWVPYPFQNNIRFLPRKQRWHCLRGLLENHRRESPAPENFRQWMDTVFGKGIADLFMRPYNFKVWATPSELMAYNWIGERVSVIDFERVLKNVILAMDDVSWGPNNTFRFPYDGGTGEIFRRLGKRVSDRILIGQKAVAVDHAAKQVRLADGSTVAYRHLLNTAPLDLLAGQWIQDPPDPVRRAAQDLTHNGVHVVGVGVRGRREDPKCWMYFPEDNCPFYRVTNFHNYSPHNVPHKDPNVCSDEQCRALMAETSFSEHKPEDADTVVRRTVDGLAAGGLMRDAERSQIVSRWHHVADYAYPVPTLSRDAALRTIQPWLESVDIYSRGRFGGWKYEVGNMDHSVMQGVEWAEMMCKGIAERTYTLD